MSDSHPNFREPAFGSTAPGDGIWREFVAPGRERADVAAPDGLVSLIDALPKLGAVLWLDRRARRAAAPNASINAQGMLLLDHPALATLGGCNTATAHATVTSQGPREWLCFRDAAGNAQAKLFLLPDTHYLAWDEMIAANRLMPIPSDRAHATFLRGAFACFGAAWHARLLLFDLKRLPWLRTLAARPPLRISLLGLEVARAIARAEGADLVSPLHTA